MSFPTHKKRGSMAKETNFSIANKCPPPPPLFYNDGHQDQHSPRNAYDTHNHYTYDIYLVS